jgi:hypothetical protein
VVPEVVLILITAFLTPIAWGLGRFLADALVDGLRELWFRRYMKRRMDG